VSGPSSKPPPRRPRISRDFLEEYRRRRYVDATAELLHEFGRQGPSVTNIVRLAGTARNSFYDVFRSAEDCIAYGVDLAAGYLFAMLDAQGGEGEWIGEVHEAIAGFYAAVAAEPILAELLLVHSAASRVDHGRAAIPAGVERFSVLLERGRTAAESRGEPPLPTSTSEYFSLAIVSLAARRVRDAGLASLPEESRAMTALVGNFYLGPEAADEILSGARVEMARL
jgi:AcrR family transcriptional regulator